MTTPEQRARIFITIFFLAAAAGFAVYRKYSVADRLVSLDDVLRDEAGADLRALNETQRAKLVPQLVGSLKSREPRTRLLAVRALGKLGPAAGAAIPELLPMMADTGLESAVGAETVIAYARIAPDPMPLLLAVLKDGDMEARRNVACGLAGLGPVAAPAAPLLTELANAEDPDLRRCARLALEKIPRK